MLGKQGGATVPYYNKEYNSFICRIGLITTTETHNFMSTAAAYKEQQDFSVSSQMR